MRHESLPRTSRLDAAACGSALRPVHWQAPWSSGRSSLPRQGAPDAETVLGTLTSRRRKAALVGRAPAQRARGVAFACEKVGNEAALKERSAPTPSGAKRTYTACFTKGLPLRAPRSRVLEEAPNHESAHWVIFRAPTPWHAVCPLWTVKSTCGLRLYYGCVIRSPGKPGLTPVCGPRRVHKGKLGRGAIGRHRIAYWGMPFLVRHYLLLVLSSISCARAGIFYPLKSSTFVRYGIQNDQEQPSCDG